jgi:hypothetical protein
MAVSCESPPEAAQRVAPLLLQEFRHLLPRSFVPRRQANLDRADHLRHVVGMNLFRRRAIKADKNPMKIGRPATGGPFAQPLSQRFRASGPGEKTVEKGTQVEPGATNHDRQPLSH